MIERVNRDIFEPSKSSMKVIAFPMSSSWKQGGYLTEKIEELCPEAKKWHRASFGWLKILNELGDVQWSMSDYTTAFCLMICRYGKTSIDFEKFEECFGKLADGAASLGKHHANGATIHMPVLKRGMPEYTWLIKDYLDDFDVFLYE